MAARGLPPMVRVRASFPSSIAATTIPESSSNAAAESCDIAEIPRIYMFQVCDQSKKKNSRVLCKMPGGISSKKYWYDRLSLCAKVTRGGPAGSSAAGSNKRAKGFSKLHRENTCRATASPDRSAGLPVRYSPPAENHAGNVAATNGHRV